MATNIPATNPIVVPASGSTTYDQWFLTQLITKLTPTTAFASVTLQRAAVVNGVVQLMPNGTNSSVSFTLDLYTEMPNFPQIGTAMDSVLAALVAYATSKKLL